jgi:Pex14 N-terminal domain
MADDESNHASGSGSAPTAASPPPNNDELHAQAVRFLTSVKLQGHASEEEQRAFLLSKGLDDAAIERAYKDATRPQEGASSTDSGAAPSTRTKQLTSLPPDEAFDAAAKAFDDPIHAELPEKTYPKSPLALYYDEASGTQANPARSAAAPESPLTRYQVLLNFFRSLSFMMMLGGGCTALVVGLYRVSIRARIELLLEAD